MPHLVNSFIVDEVGLYHVQVTESAASSPVQPVPMLDFSRQFATLRDEIMAAIAETCESQRFILGPQVTSFETAAAKACTTPYGIGCASGTDALWLALAAANIGDSNQVRVPHLEQSHRSRWDEQTHAVVTTPFSFFASASCILRAGARPIFADIDPITFNLSPEATAETLAADKQKAIKAILPVHLYGQCADWDAFTALQNANPSLLLIEDAAQAFGATWNGQPAGSLGDAAAFSFYPTKNLSAFGDAGLLTTRSSEIATHAHSLRAQHIFHQYVIRAPRRDELRAHLTALGIGSEIYYPLCLHQQQALLPLGYRTGDFPHAERAAAEVLALPVYPELRDDEQQTVVEAIRNFYAEPTPPIAELTSF